MMELELITHQARGAGGAVSDTPVLFVHGAWHGAWCWDEHFLPYFAERGFTAHALSLRSHGKSPSEGQLRWKRIAHYVADVEQIVAQLGRPPVLVGHSMGGFVVQKYLEKHSVPAAVLVASVPAKGALVGSVRTFRKHPLAFLKANLQMRLWPIVGTLELARDALFAKGLPAEKTRAYFAQLQDDSYLGYLDMVFLNLPRPKRASRPPMLVVGGTADALFSPGEVRATAATYRADVHVFGGVAHDMMLDPGWEAVADKIIAWLRDVPGVGSEGLSDPSLRL